MLADLDFALEGMGPDGIAHRFRRGEAVVDLLCVDHVGSRADLTTVPPGRTVMVPGGRQASDRTRRVLVAQGDRFVPVPVPSLLGAVIAKAYAATLPLPKAGLQRHLSDLAFLLALVPDPFDLLEDLSDNERRRLASHRSLLEGRHRAWTSLSPEMAGNGRASLRVLLHG